MNKLKGFVLFTTLIFLVIFSLLSISSLTAMQAHTKINGQRENRRQELFAAQRVINKINFESSCLTGSTLPEHIRHQTNEWWVQHGCEIKSENQRYFYVIESLQTNECAYIGSSIAHYYRVTLIKVESHLILQAILVVSETPATVCQAAHLTASAGVQMWHEL